MAATVVDYAAAEFASVLLATEVDAGVAIDTLQQFNTYGPVKRVYSDDAEEYIHACWYLRCPHERGPSLACPIPTE